MKIKDEERICCFGTCNFDLVCWTPRFPMDNRDRILCNSVLECPRIGDVAVWDGIGFPRKKGELKTIE